MALAGTARGTGTNTTSATTFTLSPNANFASSSWGVIAISADNADTSGVAFSTFTVTDSIGNTWTRRISGIYDPGAANAGMEGAVFTTNQNVGALTTGTTITVTFNVATVAKVWTLTEVTRGGTGISFVSSGLNTGAASTTPTVTTSSITNGDMVFGFLFNEYGTAQTVTGDADTTNGSWSTLQTAEIGTTAAGQTVATQWKVVNATATQTYNPTLLTSSDVRLAWISLHENVETAKAVTFTGTGTASFTKGLVLSVTKAFSGVGTNALARAFGYAKALAFSGTGTPVRSQVASYVRSLSYSATAGLAFVADFIPNLVAGLKSLWPGWLSPIGAEVGGIGYTKDLTFTGTGSLALNRISAFLRAFSFSGVATAALSRISNRTRSFTYGGSGSSVLARISARFRSISFSGTASSVFSRIASRNKSFTHSGVGTTALSRAPSFLKSFAYSVTGSLAFSWMRVFLRSFTYTGTGTSTFSRVANRFRTFVYTGTGSLARSSLLTLSRTFAYTATGTNTFSRIAARFRSISFSGLAGTAFEKTVNFGTQTYDVIVTFTATATTSLVKQVGIVRTFSGIGTLVKTIATTFRITKTYTGTASRTLSRQIGKSLGYLGSGVSSLAKQVYKVLIYTGTAASNATVYLRTSVAKTYSGLGSLVSSQIFIPFNEPSGVLKAARRVLYTLINRR